MLCDSHINIGKRLNEYPIEFNSSFLAVTTAQEVHLSLRSSVRPEPTLIS